MLQRLQPLPVLTTPRLILRPLRMEDAADYFAFASDPAVVRYLRWGPHPSLQATQAYLAEVIEGYARRPDGLWGIELAQEGRLVGVIHLMELDSRERKADVGVVVNAAYWNRGIGSEALRRVLAFCFEELPLRRVQALPVSRNAAACRMLEKCGLTHEGLLRRHALQKGQWRDFELYTILMDDFRYENTIK